MVSQSQGARKSSRREFMKSASTALAMTPIISGSISANDQPDDPLRQSSPITVGGGGSVGIDFSQKFIESGANKFSRVQDSLHKLWLIDKYGGLENITPSTGKCVVKIDCKKGGKTSTITIIGNPLSITFDVGEFKKGKPKGGNKEIYHHMKYKIAAITVDDEAANITKVYQAPTKGKCTIVVVNSL
jgi:hypothetical protein